ncbi:hypothetical protein [Microcoleus sp.]|uniref:hypothetical protein n=1 Tax=Microcoleus sp. TaxID=44472 RepID=UPI00403E3F37
MILLETSPTTTIDASTPASFTCSQCPFARLIEDNRYCCLRQPDRKRCQNADRPHRRSRTTTDRTRNNRTG